MKKRDVSYHTFSVFSPFKEITARVYQRHGGFSKKPYASLNGSFVVGDFPSHVEKNRRLVQEDLGVKALYFSQLSHGSEISELKTADDPPPAADGVVTASADIALAMTHADCQIGFFFHPQSSYIGLVHAGWRGMIHNFYGKMARYLASVGAPAKELYVGISASIGPDHAIYPNYPIFPKRWQSYHVGKNKIDFWQMAKDQLIEAGVQKQRIELDTTCTVCSRDYFSYRRDGDTGRSISVIRRKRDADH